MYINKIIEQQKKIFVHVPLTTTSGKTRVKTRKIIFEYGVPHASKRDPFNQSNYVEWQIGYDVEVTDIEKLKLTTIENIKFIAYNGKEKAIYELSEFLYYFYKWGIITKNNLDELKAYLISITEDNFIDCHKDCKILRSQSINKKINGFDFLKSDVIYPLLVYKFLNYEIIAEIKITEKQRAIGVQPMLYFCFPITELQVDVPLIGRTAKTKEFADFVFDKNNYSIIIEMIKIFGILSKSHNYDIIKIIDTIIEN